MRKMRGYLTGALILCTFLSAVTTHANPNHHIPPYEGSKELQRLKTLEGDWRGVSRSSSHPAADVTASYRITSNGSAVIETIFQGTPMEMTSVYYDREGKLVMTHYCAVANQPKLELTDSSSKKMQLAYVGGENLDPAKDMHIHELELEFPKPGRLIQRWQGFENGEAKDVTVVEMVRKKG